MLKTENKATPDG